MGHIMGTRHSPGWTLILSGCMMVSKLPSFPKLFYPEKNGNCTQRGGLPKVCK